MQFVITQTQASRIGRHFVHVSLCVASCALTGAAVGAPTANDERLGAAFAFSRPQTGAEREQVWLRLAQEDTGPALPTPAVLAEDWPATPAPALMESEQQPVVSIPVAVEDGDAHATPIDSAAVPAVPLAVTDDHASDQRGMRGGIVMIGAPALDSQPVSVTLWDEVVSPSQVPRPSDAARSAQDAHVTYSKK